MAGYDMDSDMGMPVAPVHPVPTKAYYTSKSCPSLTGTQGRSLSKKREAQARGESDDLMWTRCPANAVDVLAVDFFQHQAATYFLDTPHPYAPEQNVHCLGNNHPSPPLRDQRRAEHWFAYHPPRWKYNLESVKAVVNPPGEHAFYVPPAEKKPGLPSIREELTFQLQMRYGTVEKAFETLTELRCKPMKRDEFCRVVKDLVGCSRSFAEKAFSELDEAKKGFVDLSDLRPVPLLDSLRMQLERQYGNEARAYVSLTEQAATLLTKKELVAFLIQFGFPADPPKNEEIRGAEQVFAELDSTHSGVVDLAKLPKRTTLDRLRAEIALRFGSLEQAWEDVNLLDSRIFRELIVLSEQHVKSVFAPVTTATPKTGGKSPGKERSKRRPSAGQDGTSPSRGMMSPDDVLRQNLAQKYGTLEKAYAQWQGATQLGRRESTRLFQKLLGCSESFAQELFHQLADENSHFQVHTLRPRTALEDLRFALAMGYGTLDRAYVSLTGENCHSVRKTDFISFLGKLLGTPEKAAQRAFYCALGSQKKRAAVDLVTLRGATWEEEMKHEKEKVLEKTKLGRAITDPPKAGTGAEESVSTTPAPSGGRESPQSWAARKKDLPEQRKPRKGVYDDEPRPRERWPGVMRRELTIASSAWRPLGEKVASSAQFYSFPRTHTQRDFQPDGDRGPTTLAVGRLPGAVIAGFFPGTPANIGPGSYGTITGIDNAGFAERVGKVSTFPSAKLPHGDIDRAGHAFGEKVQDPDTGEYVAARPQPLEAKTGVGGKLRGLSTLGGQITKSYTTRAPNTSGVRNRERRFTLLQPSTMDISRDPPPSVGTYEPTVGADEHKVNQTGAVTLKDQAWRYENAVAGSTACWRNRNHVGFWEMPRKQLQQYEKARATYDLSSAS